MHIIKYKKIRSVSHLLLSILLFLMLAVPVHYQELKIFILLLLFISIILAKRNTNKIISVPKATFSIGLIFILTNLISLIHGYIANNEIAIFINLLPSSVIYPFVFFVLFLLCSDLEYDFSLAFNISSCVIILYYMLIILTFFGVGFNISSVLQSIMPYSINMYQGFLDIYSPCEVSLAFLLPYCITQAINDIYAKEKDQRKSITLAVLLIMCVTIIGRRGLLLLVPLSTILALYLQKVIYRRNTMKLIGYLVFAVIAIFAIVSILENIDILRFNNLFSGLVKNSSDSRYIQIERLWNGWLQNPIFGAGLGVNAPGSTRVPSGAYEMSYNAMLFQMGIVGLSIVFFYYCWIIKRYIISMKLEFLNQGFCIAECVGMLGILLANATNPYLQSFDRVWILFFPIMLICSQRRKQVNG